MAQSLELLLIQFLMPDNDARRQAEEQIKRLAKDPQVVPALVQHLRTAKTPNVRQLAAVLLRKKITGHWAKLSPQLKQLVKQSLIDSITMEHSSPVRRASANVVSIIAKYAVPAGEWPDLLPFLFQCSQSAQEEHREVGLILFSSLTETIGNRFRPHYADLQALLLKCLQDETSNCVRVAALKAVGSFLEFTNDGDEVVKFREFIPSILHVARQCLASGEEDVAVIAFEIFDELIESPAPLLGESVKSIVQFSLEVCSSQKLESNTRHQAIQIISWLAKYKSNSLKKHKLVIPILQVMCPLLAESTNGEEDDDLAPDRAAAEVIDTMALNLPKHVFPPVFEFASLSSQNENPKYREASVTALGVISEGCLELMKNKLEPVLHIVLGALRDHEQMVTGAASFALGQFAEHLQPEIVSHYESVLPCILNALDDASEEVKEKSYYALAAFCENMGEEILPFLDPLMGRLLAALHNSPRNLQETCMSAMGSVAAAAEQAFLPYAERVLELMKNFMVLTNDEDLCSRARATELVGIVAMSVGRPRMEPILPPFIEAAITAIQIISWLAKYKSNSLKKHKLVIPILQVMCPLLAESTNGEEDDDLAPDRAAAEVIDTMALNLPKHVFPPVFEFASLSSQNENPKYREASVTALGVISEGCLELMKNKLEPVLHIVLGALRDHEQMVTGAASFALGQFAEHLQPEIVSHYESVLPCILNALDDASEEVKEKSYYALAAFCENMGEEILPFLDPLMGRLLAALHNSPRNLQETCMSAMGSVAAAAEQAFLPYAERVLELMKNFMVLTNDEDLCSRARATELVGIVAMSVGRPRMEPILPPFIEAAITGFGLEFSELREYTHGFFSNIAEVLAEGFVQYLLHVVPLAFASCNLDDGSAVDIDDSDGENFNGFGGVSSDDEAHDESRVRNISIRTGVLDEKAAATQALGLFAQQTKSSYAPYLEESLKILVRHSGYFHEDVRLQAIIALKHVLMAAQTIFQTQNIKDELPSTKTATIFLLMLQEGPERMKEFFDTVMNIFIKTMAEDDDKEVVAQACLGIADIIKEYSYVTVEPYMPQLVDATLVLLREDSACQQTESGSDIEDDDTQHDEELMDAVSDLLPAFAKSMGSHFAPIFAKLYDPLMKFARASRPPQDRTMVVACLAEVAQNMGPPIVDYIDRVMPMVLKELASSEATNRRNAAFCVGELCKNGGESTLKYFGDILRGLFPLFGESEPDNAVRDNAAGAVARMIMVHPESIPLNQVLPVFLKVLPLKEDHEESMAVYSCVCNLVLSSNPQILSLVPELVNLFAQVAVSPEETSEVKAQVGRAFSHLISIYGQQMQPLLSNLSPVHANALAAFAPRS
ncbi:putative importin subunit beta-4 [Morella rubra]|uniref:Putative importin subunit beta-4 n=1 Tax=Morella rubra TaxID=262757 RepID=A0A6A1V2V2_9ROSI|nr:putative importin subunit beta-4 [Morella rubra]